MSQASFLDGLAPQGQPWGMVKRLRILSFGLAFLFLSCSSFPPAVPLDPKLGGVWHYQGGRPQDDPLLSWKDWPDETLEIDAVHGLWTVHPNPKNPQRTVLPPQARVVAAAGNVLTLVPQTGGRAFQVYWKIDQEELEFWWGDHADWLKPRVIYRH